MIKKLIGLLLVSTAAVAAISEPDKATLGTYKNYATNGGAENSKAGWSVSGTSSALTNLAVDTDSADRYSGNAGFTWTPANADNYLSNAAYTIVANGQLSSRNCAAKVFTKTSATGHALEAYDGTNVLASTTISASTGFILTTVNFGCPSSGTVQIRFNAGDTTAITFDDLSWGDAYGVNLQNVSQAQFIGSAKIAGTTNCEWARTSATLGAFSTDTDCPGPTVISNPGPGTIQTTDADLPQFTVNNLPPGRYSVKIFGGSVNSSSINWALAISDGTTTAPPVHGTTASANAAPNYGVTGVFEYTSSGNRTFQLYGANEAAGTISLNANTANTRGVSIEIFRFPSSSELAVNVDQTPSFWQGYHSNDCTFSNSGNTYDDFPDDATCTFTEMQNVNFGTVSSFSAKGPGIVFTPKKTGMYRITAQFAVHSGTAGNNYGLRLYDGTNNLGAISLNEHTSSSYKLPVHLTGFVNVTSIASTTVKIQSKIDVDSAVISGINSENAIYWTIEQMSAGSAVPQILNQVTSSSSGGVKVVSAYITNSGSCAVSSQDGSWISSVSDPGAGKCDITISASTFSSTPRCTCDVTDSTGTCQFYSAASSTNVYVQTNDGAAADRAFNIICVGAK